MSALELSSALVDEGGTGLRLVVQVRGDLTGGAAGALRHFLDGLSDRVPVTVEVDLAGVDFVDATGIGVLAGAQRRFRDVGRPLVFARPRRSVEQVLRLTGLTEHLVVEPGR